MKRALALGLALALVVTGVTGIATAADPNPDAEADCTYLTEHNNPADEYPGMQASTDDCGIGNGQGENGQGNSQADDHEQATS